MTVAVVLGVLGGCGGSASAPPTSGTAVEPATIDGVWLLEGTDLVIDIVEETAVVDARSDCARVLGSLTFAPGGDPTSFSLPGRDVSGCTAAQRDRVERAIDVLENVARVEADPGGLRLEDRSGLVIGFLTPGA